jgi:hypothetical protein
MWVNILTHIGVHHTKYDGADFECIWIQSNDLIGHIKI